VNNTLNRFFNNDSSNESHNSNKNKSDHQTLDKLSDDDDVDQEDILPSKLVEV
jgi:hypothetical protein